MNQTSWHTLSPAEIARELKSDEKIGLEKSDALTRIEKEPENVIRREEHTKWWNLLLDQFKSPLVFVLLIAGIATLALEEYLDATVIAIALAINIIIGFFQEKRADRAFEKLNESQERFATVVRSGKKQVIPAQNVLTGDLLVVEAGMYIPADARIVFATNLTINESSLTGEWVDVNKNIERQEKEGVPITDQKNMVWRGTLVTGGSGEALVVATGSNTQIGKIAESLTEQYDQETPLQRSIRRLAMYLTYAIFAAVVLIFVIGLFRGEPFGELLLISIAVAVAAMPSGLPAAVTVVLALGMESILKKRGLVRNLLAAETLGSTTVVLTDKTGTLTKAEMRISSIISASSLKNGGLRKKAKKTITHGTDERDILASAMLTSDAFVEGYDDALSEWIVRGRPVERAIMLASLESGLSPERLLEENKKLDIVPFESERRYAATLHKQPGKKKNRYYLTGAPEVLLEASTHVYENGKAKRLTKKLRGQLEDIQKEKAGEGLRLIALAYKDTGWGAFPEDAEKNHDTLLDGLVFGGFLLIHDPVREDVTDSIRKTKSAGARVVMVTGDNANTALRVAQKTKIAGKNERVITGTDLDEMTDEEIYDAIFTSSVFARVLPQQKMRMVKVLRDRNESVAMTGDGVNDAPALRRADIGVALGSGTEVAKEASDMILLNNSFTIIEKAIEEGRRILDNLKKIVAYLLSTSFSEIFVIAGALFAGAPLPLLPSQILWANIVEEGFMNFSFAFEPKEDDIMKRDPREKGMKSIVTPDIKALIFIVSAVTGIFLIALYFFLLRLELPIEEIRTIMFAALSVDSIFFAFSLKDLSRPLWQINPFSNKYLIFALFVSTGALLLALFTPTIQTLLSLVPPSGFDLMFVAIVGIVNLAIIELVKYIYFARRST